VLLLLMYFFDEFLTHDSRGFMIFKELLAESVGLVPFSAKYLICRHVQNHGLTVGLTDGLTDRLTN
jgi:hypothetical protein